MNQRMKDAVLKAYEIAKPHLMPELPDGMHVVLLVRFRLGDLRELKADRAGETSP